MRTKLLTLLSLGFLMIPVSYVTSQSESQKLNTRVVHFANQADFTLSASEKGLINRLAYVIAEEIDATGELDLVLVDRHNSILSQMAEVWMNVAISHYGLKGLQVRSAGVEVDPIDKEALLTFVDWKFKVTPDKVNPKDILRVDYGAGERSLFSKKIDLSASTGLIVFVDQHCGDRYLGNELRGHKSVRLDLGPSADCLKDGQIDYSQLNREIGAKVLMLVRQVELNQLQKEAIRRQRSR